MFYLFFFNKSLLFYIYSPWLLMVIYYIMVNTLRALVTDNIPI